MTIEISKILLKLIALVSFLKNLMIELDMKILHDELSSANHSSSSYFCKLG